MARATRGFFLRVWALQLLVIALVLSPQACNGARRVFTPDLVKGVGAAARTAEEGGSTVVAGADPALALARTSASVMGGSGGSRTAATTTTVSSGSTASASSTSSSSEPPGSQGEVLERTHTAMLSVEWQVGAAPPRSTPAAKTDTIASPDWGGGKLAPAGASDPPGLQKDEWDDYDLVLGWSGPHVRWSEPQMLGGSFDPGAGGWYGPGYYGGYGMYSMQLWGMYGDWSWTGWYGGGYGYGYGGGYGGQHAGSGLPGGWRDEMMAQIELELKVKLDLEESSVRVSTKAE
ncbi:hypothetical protein HXX76_005421 [Chlamydomonas incerta]|uniref:Uncharacterized protein n=1 Tax=Chlamydomonas incerta TaxID=51695 RepID=A0A835W6W7_CHLIN|nr:hypothetical protein HXX76_005421 [Chlamydomonas incerta]|eukprot:KAG2437801.1 hypothetical protein HXX76_005421 [Chlamydomonas incerta]